MFPVVGKSQTWGLTESLAAELAAAYPDVDVVAEARKALAWVTTNTRKTARGMPRFLNGWMGRAQNRGGRNGPAPATADSGRKLTAGEIAMREYLERERAKGGFDGNQG